MCFDRCNQGGNTINENVGLLPGNVCGGPMHWIRAFGFVLKKKAARWPASISVGPERRLTMLLMRRLDCA